MTTTIIFPGQGAQKIGMCKDFYESSEIVKDTFKTASDSLGYSMEDLCFVENEKLNLTEYTQPALLTCEIAMWNYMKDRGFKADYFAGHSLGEYTALVAAGVIKFADGVKIVRRRGELMQRAVPVGEGAMKVINFPIGFPKDESEARIFSAIKKWCNQYDVDVANLNSPRQLVISGPAKAVEWLADANTGFIPGSLMMGDYIDIPVSAPFHSRAMRVIEDEFKTFINGFDFNYDNVDSVYSNKTGVLHDRVNFINNLVSQISSSVLWIDNMNNICANNGEIVEIGPGKPLSGFFKSLNINVTSIMIVRQAETFLKGKGL
jgi:[acyl-carrier-protein] S-malonyltransferase/trans-AT polyketide synthase/acyltransferase/oxidoreductase domain-containing protein